MGYFPNGTSGMMYEEEFCSRCVHYGNEGTSCAVLDAHILFNYDECNKEDSILHILIPRGKDGFNEECRMFLEKDNAKR